MTKHHFGGDWTTDKLERVRKYLCAYTTIFTKQRKARYFRTIYVDAFAGSGYRVERPKGSAEQRLWDTMPDEDAEALKKGSAKIALEVRPPFDEYIFVEQVSERVKELEHLVQHASDKPESIRILKGEANGILQDMCRSTDWRGHRAVVFLDPYGMQVEWATVEAIGKTRAIDLWVLFPLGVAVNRLLTKAGPPQEPWAEALTRLLGTSDWRTRFYAKKAEETLYGLEETDVKVADFDAIGSYFVDRLTTVFSKVADNPLPLVNSKNMPIYLLCFAAGNPRGAPTAVKIAQDILRR